MSSHSGYRNEVRSLPFVMHNPTDSSITITTASGIHFSFDSLRLIINITMKTIRAGLTTSAGVDATRIAVYCHFCTTIDTRTPEAYGGTSNASLI